MAEINLKIMKKVLLLLFVFAGLSSFAQLEISALTGYRVGGKIDGYYNNYYGGIRINDSQSYSVGLDYQLKPGVAVSLEWFGQNTTIDFFGQSENEKLADVWINYFVINGIYEKEMGSLVPFGGIGLGMATGSSSIPGASTQTYFAVDLQGGVKIFLTERLGLKLKAAMLMPLQFGSAGLFCGSGGCNVGVGASTTIIQGDFSAGIVVKLGDTGSSSGHRPSQSSSPTW